MENLKNITAEMKQMKIENTLSSKVCGRRNWMIKVYHKDQSALAFTTGEMVRRWLTSDRLSDIAEYHIRWYTFTYKKDFLQAVKTLEEWGYRVTL